MNEISTPPPVRRCPCGEVITTAAPICGMCWACAPRDAKNQYQFGSRTVGRARLLDYASMRKTLNKGKA